MDRAELNELIRMEVFEPYRRHKNAELGFFDRIRCKYFSPSGNAVYLIRKMQYYYEKGGLKKTWGLYLHRLLARRYGVYIHPSCKIGKGLLLPHPTGIVITNAIIGDNFCIYQGCTVGVKEKETLESIPQIGSNVVMYANSSIVGRIKVGDNVIIAAHCCVVKDAIIPGIYIGCPAHRKD